MALQMTTYHPTGITVTDAYWRISIVNLDYHSKQMSVDVRCFKDSAAWSSGLATVASRGYIFTNTPYTNEYGDDVPDVTPWLSDMSNLLSNIYTWLKTTDYFMGATDV